MKLVLSVAVLSLAILSVFAWSWLVLVPSVVTAGGGPDGDTPIDMETDDDGNGIPDEFEREFRAMGASMMNLDSSAMDFTDVYGSEAYKVMRDFYERLPISEQTKQALDERATTFQDLAAMDSPRDQKNALDGILEEDKELLRDDAVYMEVAEYVREIGLRDAAAASGDNADGSDGVPSEHGLGVGERRVTSSWWDKYEDEFNREGDIILLDSRGSGGQGGSFTPLYVMDWSHVGLYSGDGFVFDSYPGHCSGDADNDDGVALRPLDEYFYVDGNEIMYAQLATSSWRASETGALEDAEDRYGTECETPFTQNPFDMSSDDKFFCSKLVWRVYENNSDHPVNVNSNSWFYYVWLANHAGDSGTGLGWWLAGIVLFGTVAPDEIARDGDLDNYYSDTVEQ